MATNSRHRKNHKQKVEARKKRVADDKRRQEKFQREFIMNLIKQEQEKGLFENAQNLTPTPFSGVDSIGGPVIGGPTLDGPVLEAPILDGPTLDSPVVEIPSQEETVEESKTEE